MTSLNTNNMTNKDLIAKLNNLKKISPDSAWLSSNRELLLSQVSNSGAENLSYWKNLQINLSSAFKTAAQPAYALVAFILILLTGSLTSAEFLATSKPNDSLYIARIISEQVKLSTTFNTDARDRLASQFASEHAQDISAVLANPEFNTEENKDRVAVLSDSFNKEVDTVKNRITKLAASSAVKNSEVNNNSELLVIADSAKDQDGIQLLENNPGSNPLADKTFEQGQSGVEIYSTSSSDLSENKIETIKVEAVEDVAESLNPTSTLVNASSTVASSTEASDEVIKILDEAKKLFDAKDYDQALNKLKEVDQIIK